MEKDEKSVEGIRKEYVPYATALKLKEINYDLPCLFMYDNTGTFGKDLSPEQELTGRNYNETKEYCSAPSYQAVFRFLCKYGMNLGVGNHIITPMDIPCSMYVFVIEITVEDDFYMSNYIDITSNKIVGSQGGDFYSKWHEAANAGVLKFIEIIKEELPTPWYYPWGCKLEQKNLTLHKDLPNKK